MRTFFVALTLALALAPAANSVTDADRDAAIGDLYAKMTDLYGKYSVLERRKAPTTNVMKVTKVVDGKDRHAQQTGNRALAWAVRLNFLTAEGKYPDIEAVEAMLSPIEKRDMSPKSFEDALFAAAKAKGWTYLKDPPKPPTQTAKEVGDAIVANHLEKIRGTEGRTGPQGPQGPKGDRGEKGDQGPAGPQGKDGRNGNDADPKAILYLAKAIAEVRLDRKQEAFVEAAHCVVILRKDYDAMRLNTPDVARALGVKPDELATKGVARLHAGGMSEDQARAFLKLTPKP